MKFGFDEMVSMTETNQNFSKVARLVDEKGQAVILKNNKPKYILLDYTKYKKILESSSDGHIESIHDGNGGF